MKVAIINGPNLNLLGTREKDIYGDRSFDDYFLDLKARYDIDIEHFQSNIEGELINHIQTLNCDGIVLNAGGYTHTSVALRDCIAAITPPVVEVHISNIAARESFRHESLISPVCEGCLFGFGLRGYDLAIDFFISK
jgi:3-dehydroquinate dehydratase-2